MINGYPSNQRLQFITLRLFDLDEDVAVQAREAATRIRGHQRTFAIEIGLELIRMKELLQHGQFISWIEAECNFTKRTANNIMQVAEIFSDKRETVSHLNTTTLYLLASPSTPASLREEVLKTEPEMKVHGPSVVSAIHRARKELSRQRTRKLTQERIAKRDQERERAEREWANGRKRRLYVKTHWDALERSPVSSEMRLAISMYRFRSVLPRYPRTICAKLCLRNCRQSMHNKPHDLPAA